MISTIASAAPDVQSPHSYKELLVYGLISQTQRCAVSIPSNIAEGKMRGTRKDYRNFVVIAYSSGAELETQIEIAKRLPFGKLLDFSSIDILLNEVMRMLNKLSFALKPKSPNNLTPNP